MRNPILAGLAAAAVSIVCTVVAMAQPSSLPLPPGSWRDTCGEARAAYQNGGKVLSARCSKAGGGSEFSSLRYDQCRGDIANSNGRLVCGNPGPLPPRPPVAVPDGSYKQSCRNAVVSNGRLYAECRDRRGAWVRSSIDPGMCRGRDITNADGQLSCAGAGGAIPDGSYKQSCREARVVLGILNAECRDGRGLWNRTSIDPRTCHGRDIANSNGRLVCAGGGGQIPAGSYQQSCRNARVDGLRLYAECRDRRGAWINSSLDLGNCRTPGRDIANIDGRLTCSISGGGGNQLPPGSWRASCDQAYMTGSTLVATCRDSRGQRVRTSLDTRTCTGRDIANINGRLTCGRGGGDASLVLCTQPNYGGRCVTFNGAAPSLGAWEMSDRARSLRVRGRWQVCSDRDYRGRCVAVDRDERDLGRIGFSRQISSLRPAR